jgi:hypothetical protein
MIVNPHFLVMFHDSLTLAIEQIDHLLLYFAYDSGGGGERAVTCAFNLRGWRSRRFTTLPVSFVDLLRRERHREIVHDRYIIIIVGQ